MSEPVVDLLVEKMEKAEVQMDANFKAMQEISGTVGIMKDQAGNIIKLSDIVNQLQKDMLNVKFPVQQMSELTDELRNNQQAMQHPAKQKIVHEHRAHKLIWVVIGLFNLTVMLVIFLLDKNKQLDQYKMHDIMWRFVKLNTDKGGLKGLHAVEQRYRSSPEQMETEVAAEELLRQQQEENRSLAAEKEREAAELRRQAGDPETKKRPQKETSKRTQTIQTQPRK